MLLRNSQITNNISVTIDSVDKLEDTLKKIYSGALKAEDFTPGGLMNLLKILNKAKKENGAFQVQLKLGDQNGLTIPSLFLLNFISTVNMIMV